jgi:hypothetical protein
MKPFAKNARMHFRIYLQDKDNALPFAGTVL